MYLKSFLKLVEIRTKIASMIPFFGATFYTVYHYHRFSLSNFLLMFVSLLSFDMLTTALNNYFDYKRARIKHGYNYEEHNAIVYFNLSEARVIGTIVILFFAAVVFGILLVANSSFLVLGIGLLSFLVGINYSFGPVPISRTPFGELFSGFFMGFVIFFISVYIHVYDMELISFTFEGMRFSMYMDIKELAGIFLVSLPLVFGIANIMLANNICDMEDDLKNRRYTLPLYIGKRWALLLFAGLYLVSYVDILMVAVLGLLPLFALIALATVPVVYKSVRTFFEKQSKHETFPLSVKNFIILDGAYILMLGVGMLVSLWG